MRIYKLSKKIGWRTMLIDDSFWSDLGLMHTYIGHHIYDPNKKAEDKNLDRLYMHVIDLNCKVEYNDYYIGYEIINYIKEHSPEVNWNI
jgi:hypothetical protein